MSESNHNFKLTTKLLKGASAVSMSSRPIPPIQLLIDEGIREFFEELEETYSAYLDMEDEADRFGLWFYEPLGLLEFDSDFFEGADDDRMYDDPGLYLEWPTYEYDYDIDPYW